MLIKKRCEWQPTKLENSGVQGASGAPGVDLELDCIPRRVGKKFSAGWLDLSRPELLEMLQILCRSHTRRVEVLQIVCRRDTRRFEVLQIL